MENTSQILLLMDIVDQRIRVCKRKSWIGFGRSEAASESRVRQSDSESRALSLVSYMILEYDRLMDGLRTHVRSHQPGVEKTGEAGRENGEINAEATSEVRGQRKIWQLSAYGR